MTEQRFNLLHEPCIPVVAKGRVSLLTVFTDASLSAVSGTPLQKIALMKFLLAIAQAAATPADMDEWHALGAEGLAEHCVAYLQAHEECFWLYGPRPFLQMPACEKAEEKTLGTLIPWVASGNTTLLTQIQREPVMDDAETFLLLLVQMSLCLGGKKADNKVILTPGYEEKTASAKPGPAIGSHGLLHSFVLDTSLRGTLYLNLLTQEDIDEQKQWPEGVGLPPWEKMPEGEVCPVAQNLQGSLMGRLVPMARFCLLTDTGIKFTEGIQHLDYTSGMVDPSAAIDTSGKKPRMLWADPEKRPWRQLPALLSFLDAQSASGWRCLGLQKTIAKIQEQERDPHNSPLSIWSGGVKVSSNAGEQYLTGRNDEVQSEYSFAPDCFDELWFADFHGAMKRLERYAAYVYASVKGYYAAMKITDNAYAAEASGRFWQLAEHTFQELIAACNRKHKSWTQEALPSLYRKYRALVFSLYDDTCPHETASQFEAWVRNRPFSGRNHG